MPSADTSFNLPRMKNDKLKTFGERLRWARKRQKISQTTAAEYVGISQPSYSELETGESKSSSHTPKLAKLFRVDALWLSTGDGSPEAKNILRDKLEKLSDDELLKAEGYIDSLIAQRKDR